MVWRRNRFEPPSFSATQSRLETGAPVARMGEWSGFRAAAGAKGSGHGHTDADAEGETRARVVQRRAQRGSDADADA